MALLMLELKLHRMIKKAELPEELGLTYTCLETIYSCSITRKSLTGSVLLAVAEASLC